jgi:hypothetical protein
MIPVAVVFKIKNGFLIVDPNDEEGDSYFVSTFDPAELAKPGTNHESKILEIIYETPHDKKIAAIKAVRDYCINNKYDKYVGLKDAKDHVEAVRGDWYRPSGNSFGTRGL